MLAAASSDADPGPKWKAGGGTDDEADDDGGKREVAECGCS